MNYIDYGWHVEDPGSNKKGDLTRVLAIRKTQNPFYGTHITTVQAHYPRIILAELNTHGLLARSTYRFEIEPVFPTLS